MIASAGTVAHAPKCPNRILCSAIRRAASLAEESIHSDKNLRPQHLPARTPSASPPALLLVIVLRRERLCPLARALVLLFRLLLVFVSRSSHSLARMGTRRLMSLNVEAAANCLSWRAG